MKFQSISKNIELFVFFHISVQVTGVELQKNGVTISSDTVEVNKGVPTEIFGCNIIPSTSLPPPTVIWYIGSAKKQESTTSTSYIVTALEADHDQRIYCKAYNLQPEGQAVESSKPKLYVRGNFKTLKQFRSWVLLNRSPAKWLSSSYVLLSSIYLLLSPIYLLLSSIY